MNLKEAINRISKELLDVPPHYETDGYNVIISRDINDGNINAFLAKFRGGRVISYGRIVEGMDDFSKEIVFKTARYNKLNLDNNFYYVLYEDLR